MIPLFVFYRVISWIPSLFCMYRILFLLALVAAVQVQSKPDFLSYADFKGKPYTVSYDKRSFLLDGKRSLFLGGSIHYPRATPGTVVLDI